MEKLSFHRDDARAISAYGALGAAAVHLADGSGDGHAYCIHLDPGGVIPRHVAGFDQLFLAVAGSGWAEGADGRRVTLATGEGVVFRKGEVHAKGSEAGMIALMVQLTTWTQVPSVTSG